MLLRCFRKQILEGFPPFFTVLILILSALVFWRESPIGVISLAMMCAGDGNITINTHFPLYIPI